MKILVEVVEGVVTNAIVVPEDATPSFASEVLGLPGTWFVADEGTVGVGFTYDAETGIFSAPPLTVIEEETAPEEPPPGE